MRTVLYTPVAWNMLRMVNEDIVRGFLYGSQATLVMETLEERAKLICDEKKILVHSIEEETDSA